MIVKKCNEIIDPRLDHICGGQHKYTLINISLDDHLQQGDAREQEFFEIPNYGEYRKWCRLHGGTAGTHSYEGLYYHYTRIYLKYKGRDEHPFTKKEVEEYFKDLKQYSVQPSAPAASAEIPMSLYNRLRYLGIIDESGVRSHNVGKSDYSKGEHLIQAWSLWLDYPELTSFDHDILKRVLRNKEGDTRKMDYEKIIHICEERIRQIDNEPDGNT